MTEREEDLSGAETPAVSAEGAAVTVEMYTSPTCGPCLRAKKLLDKKLEAIPDAKLVLIDVRADPARAAEMTERTGGRRTVPQIFIKGTHVGGNDDLQALEREGKLDAMLGIGESA